MASRVNVSGKKLYKDDNASLATTTYTMTYNTAASTVPAATAVAVATTAATNTSPYGYAQAQADAIVTNVNALVADVLAIKKVLVNVINDLQAAGLAG